MTDYLIVGSGLFGAVFAHEAKEKGKTVRVIEKRDHIGGNVYTREVEGIQVHQYGAHIFHTDNKAVWDYVNRFAEFNRFTNSPLANYKGELYNLPFNMNTFHQLWGVVTPEEAALKIEEQKAVNNCPEPKNLEEQAVNLIGTDIYEKLIKGYTEKQWGRKAKDLPAFIIRRVPVRFSYDNNYFNDRYQGIPVGGYTKLVEKLLEGIEVSTGVDFFDDREAYLSDAETVIYTGMIDRFFDYRFGELAYRSLRFETETLNIPNFQGNAVINYTDFETPWTRVIEHKFFDWVNVPKTVVTKEYPAAFQKGDEPYYPVNDEENNALYQKYAEAVAAEKKVIFGGRLGSYRYHDMDDTIEEALKLAEELLG